MVLWAQKEIKQSQIHRLELERADCTANLTATEDRIREIATQITQKEDRRRELELACAQSSVFQEEEKLRGRKQALLDEREQLHREMRSLAQEIKKEALRLNNLCSAILEQEAEENLLPVQDAAQGVLKAYAILRRKTMRCFLIPWHLLKMPGRRLPCFRKQSGTPSTK